MHYIIKTNHHTMKKYQKSQCPKKHRTTQISSRHPKIAIPTKKKHQTNKKYHATQKSSHQPKITPPKKSITSNEKSSRSPKFISTKNLYHEKNPSNIISPPLNRHINQKIITPPKIITTPKNHHNTHHINQKSPSHQNIYSHSKSHHTAQSS